MSAQGKGANHGPYLFFGALVLLLGGVVYVSMPKEVGNTPITAAGPSASVAPVPRASASSSPDTRADVHPASALVELAVITDRTEEELSPMLDPKALGKLLEARHCGEACAQIKTYLEDEEHFDTEVVRAEDWTLPPEDSMPTVARGLSAEERMLARKWQNVVVVRAHGHAGMEQWPARAGFAVTAALAEQLKGFVYDEVLRRIETANTFASHAITEPLGKGAFRVDRIVVHAYTAKDGNHRLVTHGLARFGSADLELRHPSAAESARLGLLLNAAAERMAQGSAGTSLRISPQDLARQAAGARRVQSDAGASVEFELGAATREEGDPHDALGRLVPARGATMESAIGALFGTASLTKELAAGDPELEQRRKAAQAGLAAALAERKGGAEVFLQSSFGGANTTTELLWSRVTQCGESSCAGTLLSSPAARTDLTAGAQVQVQLRDVTDFTVRRADGSQRSP
jgi:hypothetical protein